MLSRALAQWDKEGPSELPSREPCASVATLGLYPGHHPYLFFGMLVEMLEQHFSWALAIQRKEVVWSQGRWGHQPPERKSQARAT